MDRYGSKKMVGGLGVVLGRPHIRSLPTFTLLQSNNIMCNICYRINLQLEVIVPQKEDTKPKADKLSHSKKTNLFCGRKYCNCLNEFALVLIGFLQKGTVRWRQFRDDRKKV